MMPIGAIGAAAIPIGASIPTGLTAIAAGAMPTAPMIPEGWGSADAIINMAMKTNRKETILLNILIV